MNLDPMNDYVNIPYTYGELLNSLQMLNKDQLDQEVFIYDEELKTSKSIIGMRIDDNGQLVIILA